MISSPPPDRLDPERLRAVRATGLLDTAPEEAFDAVTRLAAVLLGVPASFVSLVDEERDFYKSCVGFGEPLATVRELEGTTFCHYAIASPGPLAIDDTRADPRYADVPTVTTLGVAAYLGVPIRTADGHAIGSLCAIDFVPRTWSAVEIEVMTQLAASLDRELQVRRQHDALAALNHELSLQVEQVREVSAELAIQVEHGQEVSTELEMQVEQGQELSLELELANEALQHALADAEQARAEAQRDRAAAEGANLAKSQFLAAMSHEIRTPINAVLGYTDLLDAGVAGNLTPRQNEFVGRVQAAGRHLLGLIEEVLDFSKIEAGEMTLAREEEDAALEIRTSVEMIAPLAEAKELALRVDASSGAHVHYLGDGHRVRQILVNLLSNAVKFTDPGGIIHVACEATRHPAPGMTEGPADAWVVVTVHDTGRGISPAQQSAIFEPFVQATSELNQRPSGTGLGLTISRRLARLMGGDLVVDSEVGAGSTFALWLPAAHADAPADPAPLTRPVEREAVS